MEQPKKQRTPKQYDDILRGASKLTLAERVTLVQEIHKQNQMEAADLRAKADEAGKLVG